MDKFQYKREQELKNMAEMIGIYCKTFHQTDGRHLCTECGDLLSYVKKRMALCPHIEEKMFCSECKTYCYAPNRRQKIQQIMRYIGQRRLDYSPVMAFKRKIVQLVNSIQEKACNIL